MATSLNYAASLAVIRWYSEHSRELRGAGRPIVRQFIETLEDHGLLYGHCRSTLDRVPVCHIPTSPVQNFINKWDNAPLSLNSMKSMKQFCYEFLEFSNRGFDFVDHTFQYDIVYNGDHPAIDFNNFLTNFGVKLF